MVRGMNKQPDDGNTSNINHVYNPTYSFQTSFIFFIPTSHAWQGRSVNILSHFTHANTRLDQTVGCGGTAVARVAKAKSALGGWAGLGGRGGAGRGWEPGSSQVRRTAGESLAPPGRGEEIAPCLGSYVRGAGPRLALGAARSAPFPHRESVGYWTVGGDRKVQGGLIKGGASGEVEPGGDQSRGETPALPRPPPE